MCYFYFTDTTAPILCLGIYYVLSIVMTVLWHQAVESEEEWPGCDTWRGGGGWPEIIRTPFIPSPPSHLWPSTINRLWNILLWKHDASLGNLYTEENLWEILHNSINTTFWTTSEYHKKFSQPRYTLHRFLVEYEKGNPDFFSRDRTGREYPISWFNPRASREL